jgi:hypothetical protein
MPTLAELENLVKVGQLKHEAPIASELRALRRSGEARLADAANSSLALESRFDLAYNAAHALASVALRRMGYRAENRYVVFQALPHTLDLPTPVWRVLMKAHTVRNQAEYEGLMQADERLVTDAIAAAQAVLAALSVAEPPAGS